MGVPVEVWRARIGRFVPPKGVRQIETVLPYDPTSEWTPAMHTAYRILLCGSLILFVACAGSSLG